MTVFKVPKGFVEQVELVQVQWNSTNFVCLGFEKYILDLLNLGPVTFVIYQSLKKLNAAVQNYLIFTLYKKLPDC